MSGIRIGEVTHYYDRISVAVIQLSSQLSKGDRVHFLGHGSDFTQEITSIQVEHESIDTAEKGAEVAVKTLKPVKPHTAIFIIRDED